jgi:hypothetical protein
MKTYEKLLLENKAWAAEKVNDDPLIFQDWKIYRCLNFYG